MPVRVRASLLAIVVFVLSCFLSQHRAMAQRLSPMAPLQNHSLERKAFQSEVSVYDCIDIHETVNQQVEQSYYLLVTEPIDALGLRVVTCLSAQTMPGRGDAVTDDYTESCKSTCNFKAVSLNLTSSPDSSGKDRDLHSPLDSVTGNTSGMAWMQVQFGRLPAGIYRISVRFEGANTPGGAACIQAGSSLPKRRLKLATSPELLLQSGE